MRILVGVLSAILGLGLSVQAMTFGETLNGSSSVSYGNQAPGTQFTCNETGTVNYILVYISALSGGETARAALYDSQDDGGGRETPNNLLVQSASQTLAAGWNVFPVTGTSVSNGTIYWICILTSASSAAIAGYTDSMGKSRYSGSAVSSFPNPYPVATAASFRLSIYVTDALPTATPTTTRTGTATATRTHTPVNTPSGTPTVSPTLTRTPTVSPTPSHTFTFTPTATESGTITVTPTISATSTQTPMVTSTPTQVAAVNTATFTATMTVTRGAGMGNTVDMHGQTVLPYPNPARDSVTFLVELDAPAKILIRIYNLSGEQVAELEDTLGGGQGRTLEWLCADTAPGVYVAVVIKDGKMLETKKVAVTR